MRVIYRSATKLRLHSSFYSWIVQATNCAATLFIAKVGDGAITRFFFICFTWMIFASCLPLEIFVVSLTWIYCVALVRLVQWLEPEAEVIAVQESGSFGFQTTEEEIQSQLVTLVVTAEGPPPGIHLLERRIQDLVTNAERSSEGESTLRHYLDYRWGCQIWKRDKNFAISNHTRLIPIQWRGAILNEDAIKYWVDDFCNGLLPCHHPPWQVAVVPYLDHARMENHAFVVRIHRKLVPFFKLSDIVTDCDPVNLELKRAVAQAFNVNSSNQEDVPERILLPPKDFQSTVILMKRYCKIAKKIFRLVWVAPRMLYTELLCSCRYWMPRHFKRARPSQRTNVYFWSDDIPQSLIQKIKLESKSKTSNILVSCLSGALKQYYGLTGEKTPEDLLAYMPMYDRATLLLNESLPDEFQTLAMPMGKGDPLTRLQAVKTRLAINEEFPVRRELSRAALKYAYIIFPPLLIRLATDFITRKYLAVINNVYVSETCGKVFGNKANHVFYWRPLLNNTGISLSLMSYEDKVTLAVMGKKELLQRPDILVGCFKRELYDLALALNVRMERQPTPPPSPTIKINLN